VLLAVDVGNTATTLGLFSEGRVRARFRLATDRRRMDAEYLVLLAGLFENHDLAPPDELAIASVVPPVEHELAAAARALWGVESHFLRPENAGLRIEVERPGGVGADRLANALAVLAESGLERAIVVDFGTATTFDVVAAPDRYLGGAIAPGPETAAEALTARAAKLPRFDLVPPPRGPVGKNTEEALQSGLVLGYAALVEGMVRRIQAAVGPARVFATGGFAETLKNLVPIFDVVDPDLTLKGLLRWRSGSRA